jgi:hypothetical protein
MNWELRSKLAGRFDPESWKRPSSNRAGPRIVEEPPLMTHNGTYAP